LQNLKKKIVEKCKSEKPEILESISQSGKLEENNEKILIEVINEFKKSFNS